MGVEQPSAGASI